MELSEAEESILALDVSDELKRTLMRAHEALQRSWERDRADAETVYKIDIPAQALTIHGEARAQEVLATLKGVKVTGTYRVMRQEG